VIEETNTSGSMQRDYIFFAGRRIAWRDSSGNVYYYFVDAIGSTRAVTNATGTTCFNADYYPYGQENDYNTSCSPTYKFTGYEFDSETGNYYAYARYYSPRLGRFLSADLLGGVIENPQSLNRYAYVLNNPETFIDPLGLKCIYGPDGQTITGDDGTQPVCETGITVTVSTPPPAPWDFYRFLSEATGPNGCGPFGCPKPPPPDTILYTMRLAPRIGPERHRQPSDSRPPCSEVYWRGFEQGTDSVSLFPAPPGGGAEDALSEGAKSLAPSYALSRSLVVSLRSSTYRALNFLSDAVELVPVLQLATGLAVADYQLAKSKFWDRSCHQ